MTSAEKRVALDQAAEWFMRRDAGPLSRTEQAVFEQWLAEPGHRAAFEEIEATWTDLAFIPRPAAVAFQAPRRRFKAGLRRQVMAAAAALIAVVGTGYVFDVPLRLQADVYTGTGEIRTVALEDGSSVTLNTGSAIAVDYTGNLRRIRLLGGEAAFDVAKDASRPFVVDTAGGEARALGTAFAVRKDGDDAIVTVIESRVGVTYPTGARSMVTLSPGQAVEYSRKGIGTVKAVDAVAETAWRRGKLIFVEKPLGQVIAELNRYHFGRIQITDSSISDHFVSGVFDTTNPVSVLDALESSLGLHSTRLTNYMILLHR